MKLPIWCRRILNFVEDLSSITIFCVTNKLWTTDIVSVIVAIVCFTGDWRQKLPFQMLSQYLSAWSNVWNACVPEHRLKSVDFARIIQTPSWPSLVGVPSSITTLVKDTVILQSNALLLSAGSIKNRNLITSPSMQINQQVSVCCLQSVNTVFLKWVTVRCNLNCGQYSLVLFMLVSCKLAKASIRAFWDKLKQVVYIDAFIFFAIDANQLASISLLFAEY